MHVVAAGALLLVLPASAATQSSATTPPALQGDTAARPVARAFTADQVARGEEVFRSYCASCHEPSFHTGAAFRTEWFGRTVYDYFKVVKTTMPEDNPAGLTDEEYTRVVVYIFSLNGITPGADSLPADTLRFQRLRILPAVDSAPPAVRR